MLLPLRLPVTKGVLTKMTTATAAKTVLVVEDEPLVMRTTSDLLEHDGYRVLGASCYKDAVATLESQPDTAVLVTDISIGEDGDGVELAKYVAERFPHVRILIVSGAVRPSGDSYPKDAIFFTKPYAPGALLTIVRDCLDC
jgi:DNA-binding NtrC family response regulator